ncbi:MAG TPA: Na+/H+ antiporter NhaA [Micromonosporaceae bacterium]
MASQSVLASRPRPGPASRLTVPLPYVPPRVRQFLADEAGSAAFLLVATVAALVWANISPGEYEHFWTTPTTFSVGTWSGTLDVRHWVNDGAMAVFFLIVGLEISREATVGDLRTARRVAVPACAALGGMALPALIYFAFEHHGAAARGWGIPISTDTAFLVGILALFGPRCPDQLRLFLLTLSIFDDIGAIAVMAVFYTPHVRFMAIVVAAVFVALLAGLRWAGVWRLWPYLLTGIALWVAIYVSGVQPTLAGVIVGLLVPASLVESEQSERFRTFGRAVVEHADPQRARLAASAARATVPANDRLQDALHPVSAFVVIPVFGLANAGVSLSGPALTHAYTSTLTIGIVVALVVGKAIGISATSGIALRTRLGDLPGRVRYGHLIGGSVLAGIGFTISLFITDLAFNDPILRQDAKIGVLSGSLLAAVLGSLLLRYLGERLPLCSIDTGPPPPLPEGNWTDPSAASASRA